MLAHRALQNPEIFTSQHYRQAGIAVAAGILIRLLIAFPVRPLNPSPLSHIISLISSNF
jgi:hypothetical protein